jgi:capsular polysaccharide transport system ATP-binding protein
MIILDRAYKSAGANGKGRPVLSSTSVAIPTNRRIALFSHNAVDRRQLINVLSGISYLNSGRITTKAKVSFPVGTLPGYDHAMTILRNVEHIAHLYSMDPSSFVTFVRRSLRIDGKFSGYHRALTMLEKRALAYVVAFTIPFDLYVLTTDKLKADYKCLDLFKARKQSAGMIIPVSDSAFAEAHCNMSMTLHGGELQIFDTVQEGHRVFVSQQKRSKKALAKT